jgi:hypothetical protein
MIGPTEAAGLEAQHAPPLTVTWKRRITNLNWESVNVFFDSLPLDDDHIEGTVGFV